MPFLGKVNRRFFVGLEWMGCGMGLGREAFIPRAEYSIDLIEIEVINKKIIPYYFVIDKSRQRLGKG